MSTRDGASDTLMVFLQGGGACAPTGCEAIESWPAGIPDVLQRMGIMNNTQDGVVLERMPMEPEAWIGELVDRGDWGSVSD